MAPTKTLGALLALFVVATGAAAAMPGNAPVDVPYQADNQTGDAEEQAQAGMNETAEDERGEAEESQAGGPPEEVAGERGPPADMPGAAPDFVSEIHATINDYLSGAVEDLGSAISEVTPGGEAGGDADERTNQDQTATETPAVPARRPTSQLGRPPDARGVVTQRPLTPLCPPTLRSDGR